MLPYVLVQAEKDGCCVFEKCALRALELLEDDLRFLDNNLLAYQGNSLRKFLRFASCKASRQLVVLVALHAIQAVHLLLLQRPRRH